MRFFPHSFAYLKQTLALCGVLLACGESEAPRPNGAQCQTFSDCASGQCVVSEGRMACAGICATDCDCGSGESCLAVDGATACLRSGRNACIDPEPPPEPPPPSRCQTSGECIIASLSAEVVAESESFRAPGIRLRPLAWVGDELLFTARFDASVVDVGGERFSGTEGPDRALGGVVVARATSNGEVVWARAVDLFWAERLFHDGDVVLLGASRQERVVVLRAVRYDGASGAVVYDVSTPTQNGVTRAVVSSLALTERGLEANVDFVGDGTANVVLNPAPGSIVEVSPTTSTPRRLDFEMGQNACTIVDGGLTCVDSSGTVSTDVMLEPLRGDTVSVTNVTVSPDGETAWIVGNDFDFSRGEIGHRVFEVRDGGISSLSGPGAERYILKLGAVGVSRDGRERYYTGAYTDSVNGVGLEDWVSRRNSWFIAAHDAETDAHLWTQVGGPAWADVAYRGELRVSEDGVIVVSADYEEAFSIGAITLTGPRAPSIGPTSTQSVLLFYRSE